MKSLLCLPPGQYVLVAVLWLGGLSFAARRYRTELDGHAQLRAAVLVQLGSTAKVRPGELLVLSAGPGHVVAGAPLEPLTEIGAGLGHVLLLGQGPWRGGESLPDGVYLLRRGDGAKGFELVDAEQHVVAVFTIDFPTSSAARSAVGWPLLFLALVKELVPPSG